MSKLFVVLTLAASLLYPLRPFAAPLGPKYDFENDPLGKLFFGKVKPISQNILERYKQSRMYTSEMFPLNKNEHEVFKSKVRQALIDSMSSSSQRGEDWVLPQSKSKTSPLSKKFSATFLGKTRVAGEEIYGYKILVKETGDEIPIAICYPRDTKLPAPAVILFSGHTAEGGLRELFVDHKSYQRAMALRLCQNGFVSLAVEKIDSGYATIHFQLQGQRWQREDEPGGGADDELESGLTLFATGDYLLPARQQMANISAVEFLAGDPKVNHKRIGAAGVSAGGWMAVHTALLNPRIKAVSNFGGMWSYLEAYDNPKLLAEFEGVNDLTQLYPGIFLLGDQNRFVLAIPPLQMQIGYGEKDYPYINFRKYFYPLIKNQYKVLGHEDKLHEVIHKGGHVFSSDHVIRFFKNSL